MHARIDKSFDVDVYSFSAKSGQTVKAEVRANRGGLSVDPILTLFDANRNCVIVDDDSGEKRDPKLQLEIRVDGIYYLVVNDAHDRGGEIEDNSLRNEFE